MRNLISLISGKKYILFGLLLIAASMFIALSILSYNFQDPSFNRATNTNVTNLLGVIGSYSADLLLQLLGVTNILLVLCLFTWGISLIYDQKIKFFVLRFILLLISLISLSAVLAIFNTPDSWFFMTLGGYVGLIAKNYYTKIISHEIFIFVLPIISILAYYFALAINFSKLRHLSEKLSDLIRIIQIVVNIILVPIRYLISKKFSKDESKNIEHFRKEAILSRPKIKKNKIQNNVAPNIDPKNSEFKLPSLDLLQNYADRKSKNITNAIVNRANIENLQKVLEEFGVKGSIIGAKSGPVVTLYELEPAAGTKSSRVIGLADDISRSMKALSSRIAVIPGRNAIGIELPNQKRETIYMREMLESDEYKIGGKNLPVILGKDISGVPIIADLSKMPHLLVAGTTGSGKSVSINTMLLSLLYALTPDKCKLILIDPKMLELSIYEGIPHLLTPVVTEPKKAVIALKWVVKEMEERYRLMSNLGVRNIAGYNEKIIEAKNKNIELFRSVQTGFDRETGKPIIEKLEIAKKELPFIVVVVDEMADLMLVAGKEIEVSIQRLSQMARAAGIHIIMATQRPSVDVITGVIKANFPTRISFHVTSRIDSRTILGEQGAEQLLGMGDMLYMGNGSKITRIHGPYVSDEEVRNVVAELKLQGQPEYIENVTIDVESSDSNGFSSTSEDDDLYVQAVDIVARDRKASTSYIQRCLRIGYNRAASIVERMEKEGIVSSANHVGKREVLIEER